MKQKTQEFDFKPFFDLIVGMLFVLIIMVSAELVFQQYNPATEKQKEETVAFENEVKDFLNAVQMQFKEKGITTHIDYNAKSLSLSFNDFVKTQQTAEMLNNVIQLKTQFTLLKLQNIHIFAAIEALKGQAANDVGEAILTTEFYKKSPHLLTITNEQSQRLLVMNKQGFLQKEGALTFKFVINPKIMK